MREYFPETKSFGERVKIEFNLSNDATKTDWKNETGFDTSKFAKKVDLGSLKSDVDKLDIDKLKTLLSNLNNLKSKRDKLNVDKLPVTVDLCKWRNVVINNVV